MSTNTSLTGPWAFALFVISIENVIESKHA